MEKNLQEPRISPVNDVETEAPQGKQHDLFELSELRLSQNFHEIVGVKKTVLSIPVDKPDPQDFFRVHPSEDMYLQTPVLQLKQEREHYLVDRSLWQELAREIIPKVPFTTVNRQGGLRLWPVRLPDENGRLDKWNRTALEAAEIAKKKWIRVAANMSIHDYDVWEATADLPEPDWPNMTFEEIIKLAFKGRFIDSTDHPVVLRLRGKA